MASAAAERSPGQSVESILDDVARIALRQGRDDLAARLAAGRDRLGRPETVIAVVGEFKRGKSSLVNGLLGQPVCPVDDDIATAKLTLLRHGPAPLVALRRDDGSIVSTAYSLDDIPGLVTERTSAEAGEPPGYLEIALNNPFLARGLVLVDTPGVGGLSTGYAGITLGYLHAADALLFATDASAPLTASELDFLKRAATVCPAVIVVLTKMDLHPEWRRVRDLDRAALAAEGLDVPLVPVSAVLRMEAFPRRDAAMNQESGYPALLNLLASRVLDPARERAKARALVDLAAALAQLGTALAAEEQALLDPSRVTGQVEQLNAERARLEHLRTAGARWQTILNDEFADLVSEVDHHFRQAIRAANRDADDAIEAVDPADNWDELAAGLRQQMAEASMNVVRELETGSDAIAARIVDVLREEDVALGTLSGRATPVEVGALWSARAPEARFVLESAATGWASLRGAQSGILVFGMLSSLAGLALTTGAMLGIGMLFGGKQLLDERKRQVTARRQKARTAVRQFLDDVQFEVGKSMRDLSRELQRQLRDHFGERIAESVRSCATTAEALQKSLQQDDTARRERLAAVRQDLGLLAAAHAGASKLIAGPPA